MSSIQFYKDANCIDVGDLGNSTGPPSGLCTQFGESEWQSFRVVTLERTCAVTIYDQDVEFCSSSIISISNFGQCMKNATVNQFSVDCQDYNIATSEPPASYVSAAATRSTIPSSAATVTADTDTDTDGGLSTGAKAGLGIAIAAVVILLLALGVFLIIRRRRRLQSAPSVPSMSELRGDNHHPTEAPPTYSKNQKYIECKKLPRIPNEAPVEAPGDQHWRGGLHEMESPSVTTGAEPRSGG